MWFPYHSITSAIVIVIFYNSYFCIGKHDIDPNSSLLDTSLVRKDEPKIDFNQDIDSLPKSDHNFYLPNEKKTSNDSIRSLDVKNSSSNLSSIQSKSSNQRKSTKCSSFFKVLTSFLKPQCPSTKDPVSHIKNVCESSLDLFNKSKTNNEGNTPPTQDKSNISSLIQEVNQSTKPESDNIVGDIILNFKPPSPPSAKDMLSFEEWRKKISEQMDSPIVPPKTQQDLNAAEILSSVDIFTAATPSVNGKLSTNRPRNFASHECGAKVVDSNVEADFVNRVLNEQTDEYMLNPCKTKNWFVIELCETIQPQYLEMANFELYSSIPKDFFVSASEHDPARSEWSVLGTFSNKDVRVVQGFKLQNNGFVKYLKIELQSYYGSEHFCPISVIRVFGTSLFDEVERIDKPIESIDYANRAQTSTVSADTIQHENIPPQQQHDIMGNARKAVFNIVARALNFSIFDRILDNFSIDKSSSATFNVYDQSQIIKLYSSFEKYLLPCESFFVSHNHSTPNIPKKCIFFRFFFPDQQFDMLFSQYFIRKYINVNLLFQCGVNSNDISDVNITGLRMLFVDSTQMFNLLMNHRNSNRITTANLSENVASRIMRNIVPPQINTPEISVNIVSSISQSESVVNFTTETFKIQPSMIETVINSIPPSATMALAIESGGQGPIPPFVTKVANATSNVAQAENAKMESIVQLPPPSSSSQSDFEHDATLSSASGQSKEAVIIRLTNRIKNLEKNISLMSTYLEQLSLRYRAQMEDMQSVFNKTINHLNNTAIRAAEKDAKQQDFIMALESEINVLKAKMEKSSDARSENWFFFKIHLFLMLFEFIFVIFLCLIFYFVFRRAIALLLLKRNGVNASNRISPDESNLIALSAQAPTKPFYRSKSLADLRSESHTSDNPIVVGEGVTTSPEENYITEIDCDNSDKENCDNPIDNPTDCVHAQSNISELAISDISAKKILQAVNT